MNKWFTGIKRLGGRDGRPNQAPSLISHISHVQGGNTRVRDVQVTRVHWKCCVLFFSLLLNLNRWTKECLFASKQASFNCKKLVRGFRESGVPGRKWKGSTYAILLWIQDWNYSHSFSMLEKVKGHSWRKWLGLKSVQWLKKFGLKGTVMGGFLSALKWIGVGECIKGVVKKKRFLDQIKIRWEWQVTSQQ